MIFYPGDNPAALLDACVLIPMCLCDTLLRLAKEPAMYRPIWSPAILQEVGNTLEHKLGFTSEQCSRRIRQMSRAFPDAMVQPRDPWHETLTGIPDPDDRHVLAAAITGRSNVLVTNNLKHFPQEYLAQFGILPQSADEFLMAHFRRNSPLVLERLDEQAADIRRRRADVISVLKRVVPKFVNLVERAT